MQLMKVSETDTCSVICMHNIEDFAACLYQLPSSGTAQKPFSQLRLFQMAIGISEPRELKFGNLHLPKS
jgi:hypothetical protein